MGISETKEFFRALDQLQEALPLEAGRSSSSAHENVFLSVAAGLYDDQPSRHLVTLGWGVPPRAAVQDLPCAILSEDGSQVVSVHRTNGLGQFQVDLQPGRYTVRFVSEVRSPVDVEALLHLGDEPALEYLQDCLADDQTLPDLRDRIEAALERRKAEEQQRARTIAELLAAFHQGGPPATAAPMAQLPRKEWSTSMPTPSGALSTSSTRPGAASVPAVPRLPSLKAVEPAGDRLQIRDPADEVPYGVVRVLAKGRAPEVLLGTCLLAMPEYQAVGGTAFCSSETRITDVLGPERDPLAVDFYVVPAAPETSAWFPVEEVEELLETPVVKGNSSLLEKVAGLIRRLKR